MFAWKFERKLVASDTDNHDRKAIRGQPDIEPTFGRDGGEGIAVSAQVSRRHKDPS
jgi:hypothetical protein